MSPRMQMEPDTPATLAADAGLKAVTAYLGKEWLAERDGTVVVVIQAEGTPEEETCAVGAATRGEDFSEVSEIVAVLLNATREILRANGQDMKIVPMVGKG